jgi:D-hexose-6-phosphate mutarotase
MLWKKSDNLKVNIAPATSRLIFVHKEFTDGLPEGVTYFGVKGNETSRFEFGAALNAYYKVTLIENVTMENILNLYSNYLDNPQNIDVDYQMNLVMKINKYMSANVAFQSIYDENAISKVQVREVFGLGVNFGF